MFWRTKPKKRVQEFPALAMPVATLAEPDKELTEALHKYHVHFYHQTASAVDPNAERCKACRSKSKRAD